MAMMYDRSDILKQLGDQLREDETIVISQDVEVLNKILKSSDVMTSIWNPDKNYCSFRIHDRSTWDG